MHECDAHDVPAGDRAMSRKLCSPLLDSSQLLAALLIAACRFSEDAHPLDLVVALDNVEINSYALQRQLAAYVNCENEDRDYHARRFAAWGSTDNFVDDKTIVEQAKVSANPWTPMWRQP
jgi:hypothetical protein